MSEPARPRVLIADDHAPVRYGVRTALERGGIEVCAEAPDAPKAVAAALRERPDACLLDTRMPGGGATAAAAITTQLPGTVVIMLSAYSTDEDVFGALRSGAIGYLLKDIDPTQLPDQVRAAIAGEAPMPGLLTARLVRRLREETTPAPAEPAEHGPELTARESEVLDLLADGAGTKEIARRLSLSHVTVRRHLSTVMAKLGVSSRAEAVRAHQDAHRDDPRGPTSEPSG